MTAGASDPAIARPAVGEIARPFLRLGLAACGGPAAHIAMMEEEFVRRRRWLGRERFLDMVGAVSLLPGPSSTELAINLGLMRGGTAGLLVAGGSFVLPPAGMTAGPARADLRYGAGPPVAGPLFAGKPVGGALLAP